MKLSIDHIILKCQRNEDQAQRELYQLYSHVLFSICKRYAANDDDAKDYFQEGFITIFQKIDQYKFQGSFEGWAKRIMVNTCLEKLRKTEAIHDELNDNTIAGEEWIDEEAYTISYQELLDIVRQLPPQYRKVFNLYVFEELKHQEIAQMLGISVNTSKSNLARARQILVQKVEDFNKKKDEENR